MGDMAIFQPQIVSEIATRTLAGIGMKVKTEGAGIIEARKSLPLFLGVVRGDHIQTARLTRYAGRFAIGRNWQSGGLSPDSKRNGLLGDI